MDRVQEIRPRIHADESRGFAQGRARIQARVLRFELGNLGNLGDHKSVGAGVWEARLTFGPGYRIYFGKDGDSVIVLLAGGAKASQAQDIRRAQGSWRDYLEARRHGKTK